MALIEAIERVLEDYGVDWILNKRNPNAPTKPFYDLMDEIKLAIKNYKEA